MADEDRSAAPDDGRSAPDDSGSDWFFRDRPDDRGPGRPARPGRSSGPGAVPVRDRVPARVRAPIGTGPALRGALLRARSPARPPGRRTHPGAAAATAPPSLRPSPARPGYPAPGGVPPLTPRPTGSRARRRASRRRRQPRAQVPDRICCCWPRCWRPWSARPPATAARGWPRPAPRRRPDGPRPADRRRLHRPSSSGSAASPGARGAEPDRHRPGRGRRRCPAP